MVKSCIMNTLIVSCECVSVRDESCESEGLVRTSVNVTRIFVCVCTTFEVLKAVWI
jgi:hypothetical protein